MVLANLPMNETGESCLHVSECEGTFLNSMLAEKNLKKDEKPPCCTEGAKLITRVEDEFPDELGESLRYFLEVINNTVYVDEKRRPVLRDEERDLQGHRLPYSLHPFITGVFASERVKAVPRFKRSVFPTFLGGLYHDKGEDGPDCADLREKYGNRLKTRGGILTAKKDKMTLERVFDITEQFREKLIQYLLEHDFRKLSSYASPEEFYIAASFAADMTRLDGLEYEDRPTKLWYKMWIRARTFTTRLRRLGHHYALPLGTIMSEDLISNIFTYPKNESGLAKALTRFDEQLWFENTVYKPLAGFYQEYGQMQNALLPVTKRRIKTWYYAAMSRERLEADATSGLICPKGYRSMQDVMEAQL